MSEVTVAEAASLSKKKHKACSECTSTALQSVLSCLDTALSSLEGGNSVPDALERLGQDVKRLKVNKKLSTVTREYHEAVKVFGKVLESTFEADVCAAARKDRLPTPALDKVIAEHLYRQGLFEVGDQLVAEAGISDGERPKEMFMNMHKIVEQMLCGNMQSALEWAAEQRLRQPCAAARPTHFEFKLHRLLYLGTLKSDGVGAALAYARKHLEQFQHDHMKEIQELMCCLVYAWKPLEESPYKHLVSTSTLREVVDDFVRECCGILGQSWESPLLVSVAAGSVALRPLLKLVKVVNVQRVGSDLLDLSACKHMPIELELGPEFNFHSIFACPVSREQSDKHNPPRMLPCGHVLCSRSIDNIVKKPSQFFKCPYCPQETQPSCCRILHFPDVE